MNNFTHLLSIGDTFDYEYNDNCQLGFKVVDPINLECELYYVKVLKDFSGNTLNIPSNVYRFKVTKTSNLFFDNYADEYIKKVILPNTITEIGNGTFSDKKIAEIILPNNLITIGNNAFKECSNLKTINLPNTLNSIGSSAFQNCTNLTTILLPESLNTIGGGAFQNCTNLTEIVIPKNVTMIDLATFSGCSKLSSVTLPQNLSSIWQSAFSNCNLSNITVPYTIERIMKNAFYGNPITHITVLNPNPNSIKKGFSFEYNHYLDAILQVPDNCIDAFKGADVWKNFRYIVDSINTQPMITYTDVYKGLFDSSDWLILDESNTLKENDGWKEDKLNLSFCFEEGAKYKFKAISPIISLKDINHATLRFNGGTHNGYAPTIMSDYIYLAIKHTNQDDWTKLYSRMPLNSVHEVNIDAWVGKDIQLALIVDLPQAKEMSHIEVSKFLIYGYNEDSHADPYIVNNLNDLYTAANNYPDKEFIIDFPLTVTHVSDPYCYVIDGEGTSGLIYRSIYGNTPYKDLDIIRAGWKGEFKNYYGLPEIMPLEEMPVSYKSGTFEPKTYRIQDITEDMINEVVYIDEVMFKEDTPSTKSSFTGYSADETYSLTFRNQLLKGSVAAGIYKVKAAVSIYGDQLQIHPIAYYSGKRFILYQGLDENSEVCDWKFEGVDRVSEPNKGVPIDASKVWSWKGYKDRHYLSADASNFDGEFFLNTWAMSPAIDLKGATDIKLEFEHASKYIDKGDPILNVRICYAGDSEYGDMNNTLIYIFKLNFPTPGTWDYVNSGEIKLPELDGVKDKVSIALYYFAGNTDIIWSDEWRIKNLKLTGECNSNSVESLYEYPDYEGPMEYYDLNGIRVYPDEELAPGIYIRRQGGRTEKLMVK